MSSAFLYYVPWVLPVLSQRWSCPFCLCWSSLLSTIAPLSLHLSDDCARSADASVPWYRPDRKQAQTSVIIRLAPLLLYVRDHSWICRRCKHACHQFSRCSVTPASVDVSDTNTDRRARQRRRCTLCEHWGTTGCLTSDYRKFSALL